jgi:tetratricopeptide (TPR) repeat protein
MGRSRWLGCSMALMVLLGGAIDLVTQPAIGAERQTDDIDRAFSEGLRLFQEGSKESLVAVISQLDKALQLSRVKGDLSSQTSALLGLGLVYNRLGLSLKALEFYNQALPIVREIGDRSGEANILNDIGRVYSVLDDKRKALEFYNQALSIMREAGNRMGEATTLNNIGGVYSALGDNSKALEFYNQALPIMREVGSR